MRRSGVIWTRRWARTGLYTDSDWGACWKDGVDVELKQLDLGSRRKWVCHWNVGYCRIKRISVLDLTRLYGSWWLEKWKGQMHLSSWKQIRLKSHTLPQSYMEAENDSKNEVDKTPQFKKINTAWISSLPEGTDAKTPWIKINTPLSSYLGSKRRKCALDEENIYIGSAPSGNIQRFESRIGDQFWSATACR